MMPLPTEPMRIHVHLVIRDTLKWSDRKLEGMLGDKETGRPLSADECRQFLRDQLDQGKDFFCGCDKQQPDGSCAGHPVEKVDA